MKSPFLWIAVLVAAGVGALYYWKSTRETAAKAQSPGMHPLARSKS